eukprot:gene33295-40279_t
MEQLDQCIFVAQTRPSTQPGISSMQVVSKQDIISNIRSKNDKNSSNKGELFLGDVAVLDFRQGAMELSVTFNQQHCSWDYSWKSNRWSGSQEMHLVDIILLRNFSPTEYLVLSSYQSSAFIIASSHKRPPSKTPGTPNSNLSDAEVLQASNLLTNLGHAGEALGGRGRKSSLRTEANSHSHNNSSSNNNNPSGSRDTEGAETLISLLGPLVRPQQYMYDLHTNKRIRVSEDAGTSDSDNSAPRHNNNAIILLPVRDIME